MSARTPITAPRSRIYRGTLRHRRMLPKRHEFTYSVWMAWLDLDELPELFNGVPGFSACRPALARFRRQDYLTPHDQPLDQVVRAEVERQLGFSPRGRICLLTQLRTLGVGFNPVSLYYCYDPNDALCAVLGEVSNTPWGERHLYACAVDPSRHKHTAEFDKAMHVSPFNPMDMTYRWHFNTPDVQLLMHMENWKDGERHFDASLTLEARPATRARLLGTLARQPWMSLKTLAGIHFEALRLWARRVPIHDHPGPDSQSREPVPHEPVHREFLPREPVPHAPLPREPGAREESSS
ncbi:DUF1365 domain-containing protein [Halomonas urumqiensis]|uniref:DUF1365 domain-containing protein n=1 Tax=Halomonas urumqiensis TaxID=1684789 RepID=A0A2N7UI25_9GAMM|nr:DUF1365 domain-containing protein [Halomonas urumqiensis]PMR80099.1 DUF1365 domain-containing protein [Halomonas urumqiensis]PTB01266.1 DUF1365 domain-containing protein [Halomonas urumqiensis]GHE22636.1 DUF1365 domain-containing protein [Halomonas urumqiensis]